MENLLIMTNTKLETLNPKQTRNYNVPNHKRFDLGLCFKIFSLFLFRVFFLFVICDLFRVSSLEFRV